MVAFEARVLIRLGRVDEAQALVEELKARAATEYVGAAVWLEAVLVAGRHDEKEEMLQLNVAAGTGPATLAMSLDVELQGLLSHPRLGRLVRQLSLYAENRGSGELTGVSRAPAAAARPSVTGPR